MTTAFKAGDKVEFTEDYSDSRRIYTGETGVVTRGGGNESLISLTLDKDGAKTACYGKRLKLHTPTFKAGDKVRNTGKGNPSWKDVEGVVVKNDGKAVWGNGIYHLVKITAVPSGFTYHSVGQEVRMTDTNMELVEAAPTFATGGKVRELKVGDKVRLVPNPNTNKEWVDVEGHITELKAAAGYPYSNKVKLTKAPIGYSGTCYPVGAIASLGDNLELVEDFPRPITFKEIQKGDTLRRIRISNSSSSKTVTEGIAVEIDKYTAYDGGYITVLASTGDDTDKNVTLELLARPEPEPVKEPEIWENRKIGEQILVTNSKGRNDRIFTKIAEGEWNTLVLSDMSGIGAGFNRSDATIADFLRTSKGEAKLLNAQS